MADQRIKGQECETVVVVDGEPQDAMQIVKSVEMSFVLEIISEGYLGETTDRYDSLFKGVKGKMTLHFSSRKVFQFIRTVIDKARRRVAGVTINVKTTFAFPNGDRVRVLLPAVEFGEIPVKAGGRGEFVTIDLDFACSDGKVIG